MIGEQTALRAPFDWAWVAGEIFEVTTPEPDTRSEGHWFKTDGVYALIDIERHLERDPERLRRERSRVLSAKSGLQVGDISSYGDSALT